MRGVFDRKGGARALLLSMLVSTVPASGADLVQTVRSKISAGDLWTGEAAVEDYRRATGVDKEYLNAVGWLARGAVLLGRPDKAMTWVAELKREIPRETLDLLVPFGAAIEVEGKVRAARDGRGAALVFLEGELARAKDPALRSRIRKNMNLLGLEGEMAPEIGTADAFGPASKTLTALRGKPVLLFFWAYWCGDCKAQAPALARIASTYGPRGLAVLAPTRYYETTGEKALTPAQEREKVQKVWSESYPGLSDVPVTFDTDTMVRYGVSATPTFALVDRKGRVRFYTPTRLSEAELGRRIEELLAEER